MRKLLSWVIVWGLGAVLLYGAWRAGVWAGALFMALNPIDRLSVCILLAVALHALVARRSPNASANRSHMPAGGGH